MIFCRTKMSEKQLSGEVIRVVATDGDIGENARISYILTKAADTVHFFVKDIDNEGSIQVFSVGVCGVRVCVYMCV